jgi:multidrug efflux pump subunit AcrB
MHRHYKTILLFALIVAVLAIFFIFKKTSTMPWEESGNLVIAIKTTPGSKTNNTFEIGIDNIELYKKNGETKQITILTKRILLNKNSNELELLLDTNVPTGEYSGIGFTMKSPEIKNPWQEDEAPEYVSLLNDHISLKKEFKVKKDTTSAIILSFESFNAMHKDNDEQVYLPIIQMETRTNPAVKEINKNVIKITGGDIENISTFGMDWDGRMRYNFRPKPKK